MSYQKVTHSTTQDMNQKQYLHVKSYYNEDMNAGKSDICPIPPFLKKI
jgi:hypothetical protein